MNNSMNMFSQESRALLLAKMTRKRADEDVVAMQNRINRLKMEEYRARKNIEDTQNKADDIVRLKAQNELKARAKEKAKQLHEEQLQRDIDALDEQPPPPADGDVELSHIEPDSAEVFEPSTENPMRSTDERRPEPETTEV